MASVSSTRATASDSFWCTNGRHWCRRDDFSNNQWNKYGATRANKTQFPKSTGMSCRKHTGEPANERRCEGPCSKVRPLDEFSKAARKAGGNGYCLTCAAWRAACDDGLVAYAPPGEIGALPQMEPQAISSRDRNYAFPFGREQAGFGPLEEGENEESEATPTDTMSLVSVSVEPDSTATTLSTEGAEDRHFYNTFGPGGEQTCRAYAPTIDSSNVSTMTTTTATERVSSSGWTKVPSRRTNFMVPEYVKMGEEEDSEEGWDSDGSEDYM